MSISSLLAITSMTVALITPPAAFYDSRRPGLICIVKGYSRRYLGKPYISGRVVP